MNAGLWIIVVSLFGMALYFMLHEENGVRQKIKVYGKDYIIKTFIFVNDHVIKSWIDVTQDDAEFEKIFGRKYGGIIEEYKTEDAEIVMISMGSCVGTMKVAVDKKREQGMKVGLIKVRFFRPFPREKIAEVLKGKKAVGIIDRSVCFGWSCGHLFIEVKPVLSDLPVSPPIIDFIDGIANTDISLSHIDKAIDITYEAAQGGSFQEVYWVNLEEWT